MQAPIDRANPEGHASEVGSVRVLGHKPARELKSRERVPWNRKSTTKEGVCRMSSIVEFAHFDLGEVDLFLNLGPKPYLGTIEFEGPDGGRKEAMIRVKGDFRPVG